MQETKDPKNGANADKEPKVTHTHETLKDLNARNNSSHQDPVSIALDSQFELTD